MISDQYYQRETERCNRRSVSLQLEAEAEARDKKNSLDEFLWEKIERFVRVFITKHCEWCSNWSWTRNCIGSLELD